MADLYNKTVGKSGEKSAVKFLKKNKYKIIEKNFTCRYGEVDIICENKGYIVFVEVKTRIKGSEISGVYAVNKDKQIHILRSASAYLSEFTSKKQPRFDIIEVEYDSLTKKSSVTKHYKNAFIQGGSYAVF